MPFKPTGFSHTIFQDRYAFIKGEVWEGPDGACMRLAKQMAIAEEPDKVDKYTSRFYDVLAENLFVPGGRIWYNSGRPNPQLLNCFVLGSDLDSRQGWGRILYENVVTAMTGGGCGQDFSAVRPRNAPIKGHRGVCPGPIELMKGVNGGAKMVRSGGGRRAANMMSLSLEHPDVLEFLDVKLTKGELDLANISVNSFKTKSFIKAVSSDSEWVLHWKNKYKKTIKAKPLWDKIVKNAYECAEPGFLNMELALSESPISYIKQLVTTNPCFTGDMFLKTKDGFKTFKELQDKKELILSNVNNELVNGSVWSNGVKDIVELKLSSGKIIKCTEDHRFLLNNKEQCMAKNTRGKRLMPSYSIREDSDEFTKLGFIQGDGGLGRIDSDTHRGMEIYIGYRDSDIALLFNIKEDKKARSYYIRGFNNICLDLRFDPSSLPQRIMPLTYKDWNIKKKGSFLRGMYSANGCVVTKTRVSYKSTCKKLIEQLKETLLTDFDIDSYITTNKAKDVVFSNGTYTCKESYDLNIGRFENIIKFAKYIGFVHKYKNDSLEKTIVSKSPLIRSIEDKGREEVFDFNLQDDTHLGVIGNNPFDSGFIAHNCGEVYLTEYESCCLGHLVLPRFIKKGKIDKHLLGETIRTSVRFLDNVLTVNTYPMPEMKDAAGKLRRIGLGTTGLADTLATLGIKYGSPEGNSFIDDLYRFISKAAYKASVMLAIEKGAFPECNPELHVKTGYVKRMTAEVKKLIEEHGIRNCAILTQAPTGCQKPDTLVATEDGLLELQELGDINGNQWQDLDLSVDQENHKKEKATKFFVNGSTETKKLTLSSGAVLEATPNHEYRTIKNGDYSWIRSDNLEIGDKLVVSKGYYKKKTPYFFSNITKKDIRENEIKQPVKSTFSLGLFLGYLFADGSVHEKGIRIACNAKEEDYKYVIKLGVKLFNIKPTLYDNGRNCMSVCFNSKMLLRWLQKNDLLKGKALHIEIPKSIRMFDRKSLVGFLRGYHRGDGSVSVDNRYNSRTYYIDTVSPKMSQQLLTVIRALGFDGTIQERVTGLGSNAYRVKLIKTKRRDETAEYTEYLKKLKLNNCTVDSVISIEDSFNLTLDIEVPKTTTYLANGLVSHNTVSILSDNCSSGIEPMFAFAYWRNYWDNEERKQELCFHPLFAEHIEQGKDVKHFVASHDLKVEDHMEVQKIIQKHVDNAVSKTINMPNNFPIKKMSKLWLEYLPFLKGITFYREGSRNYIDRDGKEHAPPLVPIKMKEAIKLYKEQKDKIKAEATHVDDCTSGVCEIKDQ